MLNTRCNSILSINLGMVRPAILFPPGIDHIIIIYRIRVYTIQEDVQRHPSVQNHITMKVIIKVI